MRIVQHINCISTGWYKCLLYLLCVYIIHYVPKQSTSVQCTEWCEYLLFCPPVFCPDDTFSSLFLKTFLIQMCTYSNLMGDVKKYSYNNTTAFWIIPTVPVWMQSFCKKTVFNDIGQIYGIRKGRGYGVKVRLQVTINFHTWKIIFVNLFCKLVVT